MAYQILIVDDDPHWRELLAERLRDNGHEVLEAGNGAEGLHIVADAAPAIVLLDWRLPDLDGLQTLRQMKEMGTQAEVVMLTAFASPKLAVQAIKGGAFDLVSKSADPEEVFVAVRCALEAVSQRGVTARLSAEQYRGLILGDSQQIGLIHHQIHEAARTNASVLITGETGTGKELAARAVVSGSERRSRPFVTVDCTTLSRELVESQLFGHERGAFTGAHQRKPGFVELADQGTLFLDEIGELELPLQAKLLRMLERKEFFRVGGVTPVTADVRVIAATNRNLPNEIKAGRFRSDLFYRLHVVGIHLPPLRERREDIPTLAEHFLSRFARELRKPIRGFTDEVLECFLEYQWPGNVRELENTIQRMAIFERSPVISAAVLPQEIKALHAPERSIIDPSERPGETGALSLEEATHRFRRRFVEQTLRVHGDKVEAAAQALHINRTYLYKLIKQLGLTENDEKQG